MLRAAREAGEEKRCKERIGDEGEGMIERDSSLTLD